MNWFGALLLFSIIFNIIMFWMERHTPQDPNIEHPNSNTDKYKRTGRHYQRDMIFNGFFNLRN